MRGFAPRKRIRYGTSLQTLASERFLHSPLGTRIVVRLGPSRWATLPLLFMWIYFVVAAVRTLLLGELPSGPPGLLAIAVFVAVTVAMFFFGSWLARDEASFLLHLLRETPDAEEHKRMFV